MRYNEIRFLDKPLPEAWQLWTPEERGAFLLEAGKRLLEACSKIDWRQIAITHYRSRGDRNT